MKTCSLYGFISALAGALLGLALYFLGFHSDPAKLATAQLIGTCTGLVIIIACIVLGTKARRAEVPQDQGFGYGAALLAGTQISIVSALLSGIFNYAYLAFINPGFAEILLQDKMDKLQAKGVSGADLDRAESMTRTMLHPVPAAIFGLIYLFIIGFLVALVVAAFMRRPANPGPSPA
jgi:hypothetical protein